MGDDCGVSDYNRQIKLLMQSLDKNGCFLQRRKMYIGLPLHNMKSHLKFDWQAGDLSVQDQVGSRFKLKQENQLIRKKYNERLDQKIYHKYVDHEEESPFAERMLGTVAKSSPPDADDTLAREVQHFNSSKVTHPPPQRTQEEVNEGQSYMQNAERSDKYNRTNDRLNQSLNADRLNQSLQAGEARDSPRPPRLASQEPQPYLEQNYRHDRPYHPNPENYYTISPPTDRYRPFQPDAYPQYSSPSRYSQPLYPTIPSDLPFRNIIPDKLENHLRDKVKADRKAVKVSLNLFDYKRP